jgi:pimeloyl-ACP methyl ester carboxylesterase
VKAPFLFIWGGDDFLITADTIAELTSVTDDITLLEIEGVGHRPQFEEDKIVIKAIEQHLSEHSHD